jgi:hypothetical protein
MHSDRRGSLSALLDVKRLRPVRLAVFVTRRISRDRLQPSRMDSSTSSANGVDM